MIVRRSLGTAEARSGVVAVLAASDDDRPVAVAVVDPSGVLLACARQDGAHQRLIRRAYAKAYTAAVVGVDTVDFRDRQVWGTGRTLADWGDPRLTTLQGGVVIDVDREVVGGIGCAGNPTPHDEALARLGREAIHGQARTGVVIRESGTSRNALSLGMAQRGAERVLALAAKRRDGVAVAAVDPGGDLIYFAAHEQARAYAVEQSVRKAYSAAFMERDTATLHEQLQRDGRRVDDWSDPKLTTLPGGVPATIDGLVLGAFGVGGGAIGQDTELASAAVAAALDDRLDTTNTSIGGDRVERAGQT